MFDQKAYDRQYWLEHKEKRKQQHKEWCLKHKDEIAEKQRLYQIAHKEEIVARRKEYYNQHKEECNRRSKLYQEQHKEEIRVQRAEYWKDYHLLNRDKLVEKSIQFHQEHKDEINAKARMIYRENKEVRLERCHKYNREHAKEISERNAISNRLVKMEVLTHYGNGRCVCVKCGFDDIRALSIDHINGGGEKHRNETGNRGVNYYSWLKLHNYPDGYQTLCMNDQMKKRLDNHEQTGKPPMSAMSFWNFELKREVLSHYGKNHKLACVKCGVDNIQVLSIDHINGKGHLDRKDIGAGTKLYRWLKKNNYPCGYQTLCMNDQFLKRVENKEETRKNIETLYLPCANLLM